MIKSVFKISALLFLYVTSLVAQDESEIKNVKNDRFFKTIHLGVGPSTQAEISQNNSLFVNAGYENTIAVDISAMFNYKLIGDYLSLGIGLQATRCFTPNFNQLGILGDVRGYLSDEINTIFLYLQIGQFIGIDDVFTRGLDLGLGVGYRFQLENHIFMIDLSSRGKSASIDGEFYRNSDNRLNVTGLFIGLGYQF